MKLRKSTEQDIPEIMNIIKEAQNYFKQNHINQWQNNYPNIQTVLTDIKNGYGYVLLEDDIIIATVSISFDGEKNYEKIMDGNWLSFGDYVVLHRLAVKNDCKGKGISSILLNMIEKICIEKDIHSIKIDTHEQNISMQRLLDKNGFQYCGVIFVADQSPRVAYEKILTL